MRITPEANQFLIRNYKTLGAKVVAEELGITTNACHQRWFWLKRKRGGVEPRRRGRPLTPRVPSQVEECIRRAGGVSNLARLSGASARSIYGARSGANGLSVQAALAIARVTGMPPELLRPDTVFAE